MKSILGMIAALTCSAALAATVEYDPAGSGTWGEATRWKGGQVFAAGDTVLVNGCTAMVSDDDREYFASAAAITFAGASPTIVISNTVNFAGAVTMAGNGKLLKLGSGEFKFTSNGKVGDSQLCFVDIEIKDGTLSFQDAKPTAGSLNMKSLSVWAPGRFMGTPHTTMYFAGGLYGDGIVDNKFNNTGNRTMNFVGSRDFNNPAVFSGDFVGDAYYCSQNGGAQYLIGDNSSASRGMLLYSGGSEASSRHLVGISSFGNTAGVKAPWGTSGIQWRGWNNHLLYLGTGETSNRSFYYGNGGRLPKLDAGEHGNLTLTGKWDINKTECNFMNGIDLAGGGTNHFQGAFASTTNKNGRPIAVYVRKLGPGAWRFNHGPVRDMCGVFETVEGELQFDYLSERGKYSSLGDSSVLHERYCGEIDDARAVPYAYLLGNGINNAASPTLATMNYTGLIPIKVTTRPIAVNGAGRLKSDTAEIAWGGITSAKAGEHSIVLGGSMPMASAVAVTNGPGTLAVVKDGAGNWTLDGDLGATGGFKVKQGGLYIADNTKYEWYRLTFMGSYGEATNREGVVMNTIPGEDGTRFATTQWALLSEDGENQIVNVPHNSAADGKPYLLEPGEAAMANTNYCYLGFRDGVGYKYVLANLFQVNGTFAAMNCTFKVNSDGTVTTNDLAWSKNNGVAYVADESLHVRVVVRLPADAKKVTHYDLRSAGAWPNTGSQIGRIPRSWKLEGSSNGIVWHTLDTVISNSQERIVTNVGGSQKWLSNNSTTLGEGFGPLSEFTPGERPASVATVSAAGGAILETRTPIEAESITYDAAASGGTIRGFTLSENATVEVTGITEAQLGSVMPLNFEGAAAYEGRRLAVTLNGTAKANYSAYLSQSGLKVLRKGLGIIVR